MEPEHNFSASLAEFSKTQFFARNPILISTSQSQDPGFRSQKMQWEEFEARIESLVAEIETETIKRIPQFILPESFVFDKELIILTEAANSKII